MTVWRKKTTGILAKAGTDAWGTIWLNNFNNIANKLEFIYY